MIHRPLYIFDLDGTLALTGHRSYLLRDDRPDKWRRFFSACEWDQPNEPVIRTMEALRITGAEVWIFSGRSDEVREQTVAWLERHTSFMAYQLVTPVLRMRAEGDYTPDDDLKRQWWESLPAHDRDRLVAVYDDRDKVVSMWRSMGVACFQVAPGKF